MELEALGTCKGIGRNLVGRDLLPLGSALATQFTTDHALFRILRALSVALRRNPDESKPGRLGKLVRILAEYECPP